MSTITITKNAENTNFLDSAEAAFGNLKDMATAINTLESESQWFHDIVSKEIRVKAVTPMECLTEHMHIPCSIKLDTAQKGASELMITDGAVIFDPQYGSQPNYQCLRASAVTSLCETAKINGAALGRLQKPRLEEVINTCLDVARGKSLVLMRRGKVSAILSESVYEIMPQSELLAITVDKLREKFGEIHFHDGYVSNEYTNAMFLLEEAQDEILDAYKKITINTVGNYRGINFMPCVRFSTSDVGACAATLTPYFRMPSGAVFRVSDDIKVDHKHAGGDPTKRIPAVTRFKDAIDTDLLPMFVNAQEKIEKMVQCTITHPINALVGMCKKAGLPKKYISRAQEELQHYGRGRPCSMHDIYLTIAEISGYAMNDGIIGKKLEDITESIYKILAYDWAEFDVTKCVAEIDEEEPENMAIGA